jgi:hypothetical protein
MNVACNYKNLNKQFNTRVSSWSGAMDALWVIGKGAVKANVPALGGSDELYTLVTSNLINPTSCKDFGKTVGRSL